MDRKPITIRLESMSEADFQLSREAGVRRNADWHVERGLWTREAALETSRSEFDQLLPQGRATPNRAFYHVLDGVSGSRVGELWTTVEQKGGRPRFWVDWITIFPESRRRGYASRLLESLASEAADRGADRLGLHVEADNLPAVALYKKLGFEVTSMRLAKRARRTE